MPKGIKNQNLQKRLIRPRRGIPDPHTLLADVLAWASGPRPGWGLGDFHKPASIRKIVLGQRARLHGPDYGAAAREADRAARYQWHAIRWVVGCRRIDRILVEMLPGHWYGAGDLAELIGETAPVFRRRVRVVAWRMHKHDGLTERARNPDWRRWVTPWEASMGVQGAPRWLYRLTRKGEALRILVRWLR